MLYWVLQNSGEKQNLMWSCNWQQVTVYLSLISPVCLSCNSKNINNKERGHERHYWSLRFLQCICKVKFLGGVSMVSVKAKQAQLSRKGFFPPSEPSKKVREQVMQIRHLIDFIISVYLFFCPALTAHKLYPLKNIWTKRNLKHELSRKGVLSVGLWSNILSKN